MKKGAVCKRIKGEPRPHDQQHDRNTLTVHQTDPVGQAESRLLHPGLPRGGRAAHGWYN